MGQDQSTPAPRTANRTAADLWLSAPLESTFVQKCSFHGGRSFTSFTGWIPCRRDSAPPKWALPPQTPRASVWTWHFCPASRDRCAHAVCRFPGIGRRSQFRAQGAGSGRTGSAAIGIHESVKDEHGSLFSVPSANGGRRPIYEVFSGRCSRDASCLRGSGGAVSCCRAPVWTRRVGRVRPEGGRRLCGARSSIHPMKRLHHPSPGRRAALPSGCLLGALPSLCRPRIAAERRTSSERTFPCA